MATKQGAHAEGLKTQAIGEYTHAQGVDGIAEGRGSMVAGYGCVTTADAKYAIAAGDTLIATAEGQAVFGKYNECNEDALFIVGNGEDEKNRSNALTIGNNYASIVVSEEGYGGVVGIYEDGVLLMGANDSNNNSLVGMRVNSNGVEICYTDSNTEELFSIKKNNTTIFQVKEKDGVISLKVGATQLTEAKLAKIIKFIDSIEEVTE